MSQTNRIAIGVNVKDINNVVARIIGFTTIRDARKGILEGVILLTEHSQQMVVSICMLMTEYELLNT